MNRSITYTAWAGQAAMLFMFSAMLLAWKILPPPSASLPLEQWAQHFSNNATGVYIGAMSMMLGASLFMIFFGGLFACLKRMEGNSTPLTYAMIMIVPFGFFPLFAMAVFLVEAAFRPGMNPEIVGMLADLSIFMLVIPGLVGLVQYVGTGIVILRDVNAEPIFPRWTGYASIWVGIISLPGAVIPFFKTGPFAWNGIITFWIPAIIFGMLVTVFTWAMIRAAKHPSLQAQ
jgi:hypothetical protein